MNKKVGKCPVCNLNRQLQMINETYVLAEHKKAYSVSKRMGGSKICPGSGGKPK